MEFDPENLAASAEILFFMYYFKILVRTLTLHWRVIPTVNQDVSIFVKKINSCFCFIHQDNHFIQKYLTKQCCLLIMFSVHFKFFSGIIVSCKHYEH